jgi:septal ring-binding cell division protein DamX
MLDFVRNLLFVSTCLAITACGSWGNKHGTNPITPTSTVDHKDDYWFCQANEAGVAWDCVQSPHLAMNQSPTRSPRTPEPEPTPIAKAQSIDDSATPKPDPQKVATNLTNTDLAAEAPTVASAPPPRAAPAFKPNPRFSESPDWQRLAYRPFDSIALSELPAHFYAVQIVAMSSMESLQSFAKEHLLNDALTARVEANGKFFYVLLLGTYETRANANAAAASRPEPLMNIQPWVRKVGSLQDAIARGDLLAETTKD